MSRWSALAILLIFAGALVFRLTKLDIRPLHNDEAVNATKVAELWQNGRYVYDPDEYHGPTLQYATLPFLWWSGAKSIDDIPDRTLRLAPVAFGAALILLLFLFVDALGWTALIWSALFIAISPAMVFYSRYFIHEMLLVFFTALALGAGWRYTQSHSSAWAAVTGAAVGLMFATKETFVLNIAAAALAMVLTFGYRKILPRMASLCPKHIITFVAAALLVWVLLFSSFFTNFNGLPDSIRAYLPWLKRAAGHSPHLHPWYFYFHRLGWFHPTKGLFWSEGLILILALIGAIVPFRRHSPPRIFLTGYSFFLAAIYSVISYKTPWCLLNFYFGLILLAGLGAAAIVDYFHTPAAKIATLIILLALTAQLSFQSWRASFVDASDRRNPYVYAQTVPDILNLVRRAEGVARSSPASVETIVKVIAPEGDYWPLPWYLRRFKHIGWYDKLPEDPFAPIIIVAAKLDARLDDKSDRKWIMTGVTEFRPTKFFELYVEKDLWTKYVENLPPEPE